MNVFGKSGVCLLVVVEPIAVYDKRYDYFLCHPWQEEAALTGVRLLRCRSFWRLEAEFGFVEIFELFA